MSDPQQIDALPAQKKRLLEYAALKRLPYTYVPFDESAYKGKREKFKERVIDPISKAQSLVTVVFDKIDRFSRDSSSIEKTLFKKLLRQSKIELHFPSDNLYIHRDSPAPDLFRLDIGVALSAYYGSTIRDNVNRRFEQLVEEEKTWIGRAPFGYSNIDTGIPIEGKKGKTKKDIQPDPATRQFVVMAFELRATGMSYEAVAQRLRKAGMLSSVKGQPILTPQVERLLKHPFYYGYMRYKREVYPHRYEPLISASLWRKVQEVNERRAVARTKYATKDHLYRDFLSCDICGYTVTTDGPKKGKYYYLKCTEYGGSHGAKWSPEQMISAQVAERVFRCLKIPQKEVPSILTALEQDEEETYSFLKGKIRQLRVEHGQLDEEVKDMFRDRRTFQVRPELFAEIVSEKTARQALIEDEIASCQQEGNGDFLLTSKQIVELARRAGELFLNPDVRISYKRRLLRMPLSNLAWDGENIKFELKEPYATIAACQKNDSWCALALKFRTECRSEVMALRHDLEFRDLVAESL
ncbi:recombinase family protein [Streptomyces agglomeratus]|uniref:recombinase family protein n=1 Tax=Streptomyces agglomeratus TaxID=285458 RepID=UPI00159F2847|nr:recombinase family protein [Streptomyces agglomeratus]